MTNSFISKWGGLTESYWFYKDSPDPIELRYDPKDHVYLLVTDQGLEKVDGVTQTCHIIDKSNALIPWAVKMMHQKLLRTVPVSEGYVPPMKFEEFEKLSLDAKGAHKDKLEEAGAIGDIAHAWIENYIKIRIAVDSVFASKPSGDTYEFMVLALQWQLANKPGDVRAWNACNAALDWMSRHNVRWICTERKIYSRAYKYAGTMDGLCICDSCYNPLCCPEEFIDRLSVADWKTSNHLYMEYVLQTAGYENAYEEENHVDIEDRWIIRLGKEDGEFEPWHLEKHNFSDDFGGFLDALDLTRRVRLIEGRIAAKKADIRAALKEERNRARIVQEAEEKARKAEEHSKKQKARVEALALACTASKTYKGVRKPTCKTGIGGGPCVSCAFKYAKMQETKDIPTDLSLKALGYEKDIDGLIIDPNGQAEMPI